MSITDKLQVKISKRHEKALVYELVTEVINRAGVSSPTYYRAVNADPSVRVKTKEKIAVAQREVIAAYELTLQNA